MRHECGGRWTGLYARLGSGEIRGWTRVGRVCPGCWTIEVEETPGADMVTLKEAAELAGVRYGTAKQHVRRGKLAGRRYGDRIWVEKAEVERYRDG